MKELNPIEQYEVIRFILATRTKDVSICKHNVVNEYIEKLIAQLPIQLVECSQ